MEHRQQGIIIPNATLSFIAIKLIGALAVWEAGTQLMTLGEGYEAWWKCIPVTSSSSYSCWLWNQCEKDPVGLQIINNCQWKDAGYPETRNITVYLGWCGYETRKHKSRWKWDSLPLTLEAFFVFCLVPGYDALAQVCTHSAVLGEECWVDLNN